MSPSLEVLADGQLIFSSDRRWLYPLLDLHAFLVAHPRPAGELVAVDRVVGKAAAMIMVHLGVRQVRAGTMSRLALAFLEGRRVPLSYQRLVPRILCRTETLLEEVDDPAEAFHIVKRRAEGAA